MSHPGLVDVGDLVGLLSQEEGCRGSHGAIARISPDETPTRGHPNFDGAGGKGTGSLWLRGAVLPTDLATYINLVGPTIVGPWVFSMAVFRGSEFRKTKTMKTVINGFAGAGTITLGLRLPCRRPSHRESGFTHRSVGACPPRIRSSQWNAHDALCIQP